MQLTKAFFDDLLDDLDEFRLELLKGKRCGYVGPAAYRRRMNRQELADRLAEIRTKITDLEIEENVAAR